PRRVAVVVLFSGDQFLSPFSGIPWLVSVIRSVPALHPGAGSPAEAASTPLPLSNTFLHEPSFFPVPPARRAFTNHHLLAETRSDLPRLGSHRGALPQTPGIQPDPGRSCPLHPPAGPP